MTYKAPVAEQAFVLDHIAGLSKISSAERFADATPEMVASILEGAGAFAEGEWEPLDRIGDTVGARWTENGVVMPEGYRSAYKAYVAQGWGTVGTPVEAGGQGLPFVLASAVQETLGSANMGFAMTIMLSVGAIEAIDHHGSARQKAVYLPRLANGEWTGTMNLTEPQAGSDVGAVRTRAVPRGDGTFSIKGTKIFITFGDHDMAENIVHLVLARTPDAPPGTKGLSLFLVPKYRLNPDGTRGQDNDVRVVSIEHKMGINVSPTCVMSYGDNDDCIGELIGRELGGIRAMFTMMNNARLNVGLQGVQVAERAMQSACAYAQERIQGARASAPGNGPVAIVEHPDVRRMLLRMRAQTMAARALVYHAAGQADCAALGEEGAQERLDLLTPLAKAHATDLGCEVSSLAVQVHGGMGFIEETGAAKHFRDARITPIYEGTNGIQAADLVGRKLAMRDGGALADLIADMREEAVSPRLGALIDACERVVASMRAATTDDRLAGSYPFLTMLSVAVCGWLMERSGRIAQAMPEQSPFLAMKATAARYYVEHIVPEALGHEAAATAGAGLFYALPADHFSA